MKNDLHKMQIQPEGSPTIAVGARGVGCILQAKRRIQLLDLEEEEDEDDDGEEGENEDESEGNKENAGTDVSRDESKIEDDEDDES